MRKARAAETPNTTPADRLLDAWMQTAVGGGKTAHSWGPRRYAEDRDLGSGDRSAAALHPWVTDFASPRLAKIWG